MKDGGLDFQELHRTFHPKIVRYLTRLVGQDEAKDLAQEVFLKVSRSLKEFQGRSRPSTWIYRIATNAALDRLRSASFKRTVPVGSFGAPDSDQPIGSSEGDKGVRQDPSLSETALIRKEMLECLGRVIDELPVSYRSVLVLSLLAELKNKEIAAVLGISLHAVKIRLHRGRAMLQKELETHCGFYRDSRSQLCWDGTIK